MGLRQSRMQEVALKKRRDARRDDQRGYEADFTLIQASIQPMSGATLSQMYGQQLSEMRLLLTRPEAKITDGMGVCLAVPPDAHPDYRVVYTARWARHTVAHLALIPEPERSDMSCCKST